MGLDPMLLLIRCVQVLTTLFISKSLWADPYVRPPEALHQVFEEHYASAVSHRLTVVDIKLIKWATADCGSKTSVRCKTSRMVLEYLSKRGSTGAKLLLSAQLLDTGASGDRRIAVELLKGLLSEHESPSLTTARVKPLLMSLQRTPRKPARPRVIVSRDVNARHDIETRSDSLSHEELSLHAERNKFDGLSSTSSETELNPDQEARVIEPSAEMPKKKRLIVIIDQ